MTYWAVAETTEWPSPRTKTLPHLRAKLPAELASIDAAAPLLDGRDGERLRAWVGRRFRRPAWRDLVRLTTETPAGTAVVHTRAMFAVRCDREWPFIGDASVSIRRGFRAISNPPITTL